MPRKPREFVDQGIYHVFNRGNNRSNVFQSVGDYLCFLNLMQSAKDKYEIQIFHYCLMTNHFHFLLRSNKKNDLPAFMHWLQLGYVRYFKSKYETTGHVFEERFRSPRIAEESYYLQCGRYIERNPVKANVVSYAWHYVYSSASFYVEGKSNPLITPNIYYLQMGGTEVERKKSYQKFLLLEEPYEPLIGAQLLKH